MRPRIFSHSLWFCVGVCCWVIGGLNTARLIADSPARPDAAAGRSEPVDRRHLAAVDALGDPLPEGARIRFGTLRFRSPDGVQDIALSPDDKSVVTVGRELIVWDAATGQERWKLKTRDYGYRCLPRLAPRRPSDCSRNWQINVR